MLPMQTDTPLVHIIGAGLAGSEAALQLAERKYKVMLYDMKPVRRSPAHHSDQFAEIVCSNSFGSQNSMDDQGQLSVSASGLLKQEMEQLGCYLLNIAQQVAVPAGKALAVDRDAFSLAVTRQLQQHPNITLMPQPLSSLPTEGIVLVATGPLTTPELAESIAERLGQKQLYFFDAASPIITKESINLEIAFIQDRYQLDNQQPGNSLEEVAGSYINCPLNRSQYEALHLILLSAEKNELKPFEQEAAEKTRYFESCLPVEVIASRGVETLRYGPMKPVGLVDPNTQSRPYAVVQLRQDNTEGTLYNMVGFQTNLKWGAQKLMIQSIPGLEQADIVRYGVMHRNTYIHSPAVLLPTLQHKHTPSLFFAGQLTGTEGYTESIATGLFAALNIHRQLQQQGSLTLPRETMLGALLAYITRPEAITMSFQPINSNWGLLPPLENQVSLKKNKKLRNQQYVERSLKQLQQVISLHKLTEKPVAECFQ
jgi:methylenetetrahydrofolate--tRNA-(uracil-5-)-methyltransferase